jgi:hypothetical protein
VLKNGGSKGNQMNFDNIPIKVIEQVELETGFLIEDLFKGDNKSPYRKRAIAYLSARSQGLQVTWEEMGDKTVLELTQMMGADEEDPKE